MNVAREPLFKRRLYAQVALTLAAALALGFFALVYFSIHNQSGWRCFDEPHDPKVEVEAFRACIVAKTREDMKRSPHLYGLTARPRANSKVVVQPDAIEFDFLGVRLSYDSDPGFEAKYAFRYMVGDRPYCMYSIPSQLGGPLIHGAYPEEGSPHGC